MKFAKLMLFLIVIFLLLLTTLLFTTTKYINEKYVIDEILYYLTNGIDGTSEGLLGYWIRENVLTFVVVLIVILVPILVPLYKSKTFRFRAFKKKCSIYSIP